MSDGDYVAEQRLSRETAETKPYPYYAVFIALYNALFAIFLLFYRRSRHPMEQITPLDLTMLGLSTLRLSKAISEDEVSVVLRKPLVDEAGGERRPQGHGFRYALGKLILCPTCTGTWIAAVLGYALHLSPRYTRPFLAATSASGISQFADALLSLVYTDRNVLRRQEER